MTRQQSPAASDAAGLAGTAVSVPNELDTGLALGDPSGGQDAPRAQPVKAANPETDRGRLKVTLPMCQFSKLHDRR